jgi:hypothetical protein
MAWYPKETPTPFDNEPIPGLQFLDGNLLALLTQDRWFEGHKYPTIVFPSGKRCMLWEGSPSPVIHVFGEMDLPLYHTRDQAWELANDIAEACGYLAKSAGDDQLEVWGHDDDEHFLITYAEDKIFDVQAIKDEKPPSETIPNQPLLTPEIRAQLPPLYANEHLGLQAIAPVKLFLPGSGWTWYASEFDGEDLFFGLVAGFEIELGYFSLSELQEVRSPLGLPIERDLYYQPKTLGELKTLHAKGDVG